MMKILSIVFLAILSFNVMAEECANNVAELKGIVGNNGLSLHWKENTNKNPLLLTLNESAGSLNLRLRTAKGEWATVTGMICTRGDNYVAKVSKVVWGSEAPGIAKAAGIKEIKLKLPYPNVLKVSVSLLSFEFSPAD
jgi:hypothetical protein